MRLLCLFALVIVLAAAQEGASWCSRATDVVNAYEAAGHGEPTMDKLVDMLKQDAARLHIPVANSTWRHLDDISAEEESDRFMIGIGLVLAVLVVFAILLMAM